MDGVWLVPKYADICEVRFHYQKYWSFSDRPPVKVALLFVLFVFGASFSSEKEDALFISIYPDYRILNENLPMKQIKHTFEEKKENGRESINVELMARLSQME